MGVLDKIKNALFEVEYVEVDEKPKKEKKPKKPVSEELDADKPIAKKIVLPGKKEEKVEELQEEELKDEDFEIRPKDEAVKEVFRDNFNVMGDDDFLPPETTPVYVESVSTEPVVCTTPVEMYVSPETQPPTQPQAVFQDVRYADKDYVREYDSSREKVLNTVQDGYHVKSRESKPYGMDPSYHVSIKEYGKESKDDKTYFKPSPIISPIYGILDKNYKKEDVVSKKEIRITSSYSRTNMNVDDIRNKAYGRRNRDEFIESPSVIDTLPVTNPPVTIPPVFTEDTEDENLLVDLTDEKKPEVKEITVGDAMEYFHDLGLEYNVDYVDASNRNQAKKKTDDLENDIKDTMDTPVNEEPVVISTVPQEPISVPETQPEVKNVKKESPVVEVKDESNAKASTLDDDDNLFDLIDSMYREEDN